MRLLSILSSLVLVAMVQAQETRDSEAEISTYATASAIANAILNFQTEYRTVPFIVVAKDQEIRSNHDFCTVMEGKDGSQNRRMITFLQLPEAANLRSGFSFNTDGERQLVDSWGNLFTIFLDGDGNGRIEIPDTDRIIRRSVAVLSPGPDGSFDTENDNVSSWAAELPLR